MMHELKIWPQYFQDVLDKKKTFEVRKDDRPFLSGDTLKLMEWNPETQQYTGKWAYRTITYVLRDEAGIEFGYCVLGIE